MVLSLGQYATYASTGLKVGKLMSKRIPFFKTAKKVTKREPSWKKELTMYLPNGKLCVPGWKDTREQIWERFLKESEEALRKKEKKKNEPM